MTDVWGIAGVGGLGQVSSLGRWDRCHSAEILRRDGAGCAEEWGASSEKSLIKMWFKPENWERVVTDPALWHLHSHCTDFGFYSEGKIHCVLSREVSEILC